MKRLSIFLCHAFEDKRAVRELSEQLRSDGFAPWIDEDELLPGQEWEQEITRVVRNSDVFIACLSFAFTSKAGYGHTVLRLALDIAHTQTEGAIFVIPARLEQCEVPERLRHLHVVDLLEERGYEQLKRALQRQAETIGVAMMPLVPDELPLDPVPIYAEQGALCLSFTNRKEEQEKLHRYLQSKESEYIQILAHAGLGKTYFLREIQRQVQEQGWQAIWIDFAERHKHCQADRFAFLQELFDQFQGKHVRDITHDNERDALLTVEYQLATRLAPVAVFLDNADRVNWRILEWIRATLLPALSRRKPIYVIASSQRKIMEWQGCDLEGKSFRKLPLSGFNDTQALREIISEAATQSTASLLEHDLDTLVRDLFSLTRGHPRAIERVLHYLIERDGCLAPTSLTERHADLCERCLSPIVHGHIFPTLLVPDDVQKAFHSLCVFRYVWPGLIDTLTSQRVSSDQGGPWKPFSERGTMASWWPIIKSIHLIYETTPRMMFPISPVIRQLIAQLLQHENLALYQARNQRARHIYESLLISTDTYMPQRAAWFIEVLYHLTQDGSLNLSDGRAMLCQRVKDFLNHSLTLEFWRAIVPQLFEWVREDNELREAINRWAGNETYGQVLQIIEDFIHDREDLYYE